MEVSFFFYKNIKEKASTNVGNLPRIQLVFESSCSYLIHSMHYYGNQLFRECIFHSSYGEHENITFFVEKTISCFKN